MRVLTSAVPANATSADKKLKNRAFDTLKPDRTKIPKSPTCITIQNKQLSFLASVLLVIYVKTTKTPIVSQKPGRNFYIELSEMKAIRKA